jgi:uncharacterized protein with GYD domain
MATYVVLLNFTDQGIRNVKQTVDRARAFKASAERFKATVRDLYWTQGAYDLVAIVEAPDEKTGMALLLTLCSLGNIRSHTLRAYSSDDMKDIIAKMG